MQNTISKHLRQLWTIRHCRPRTTLERRVDRCRGHAVNTGIELGITCSIRIIGGALGDLIAVPAPLIFGSLDAGVLWPSPTSLLRGALVSSNRHALTH